MPPAPPTNPEASRPPAAWIVLRAALALAGIAAAIGAFSFQVKILRGDLNYARAEAAYASLGAEQADLLESAAGGADAMPVSGKQPVLHNPALLQQANRWVEESLRWNPVGERALLVHTKNLILDRRYEEARGFALRANRALVTEASLVQLGWISLELGDRPAARSYFGQALAINPANIEALERMVWIAKLDLNKGDPQQRPAQLQAMLESLRALQRFAWFSANTAYLWSQYWHERTLTSRDPIHFLAGYRCASLAQNRPAPRDVPRLYNLSDPLEAAKIANYFMMGARGLPVLTTGQKFAAKRPVKLSIIRLD